jgi:uncharacterized phiE125 gp8 family phage protein
MLIELEDLKNHIGLDSNDDDEILKFYIEGIGEFLKERLGLIIESASVTEYFNGDDIKDIIFLANYPVTVLTSLQYNSGTWGTPVWTAFDVDDYNLDGDKGMIYCDSMYAGIRNIKVVYTAGYSAATIPKALKIAVLKMVAKIYNKRRSDGFSSEEVAGARVEWDKFLSSDIEELIAPYRKIQI